ncbi:MAG TPA: hypothetical protein VGR77_00025 [Candidatus Dormibacteraeota bacterium]|nr:hypothetical protein [Candidatus Dormibacteraeota bacterium]
MFRPARRVSWGTWIFVILVLALAIGAVGGFLEVVLPQRVAQLAQSEASELALARKGATEVSASVTSLWAEISAKGSMSLSDDRLAQDLALAKSTEKAADDALGHIQTAQSDMAQADGLPFQLHSPAFVATDRPHLQHLDNGLQAVVKLTHAATLQLTLAQHLSQSSQTISGTLDPSLNARSWTAAARAASALATDLKSQQAPAADPEALLDPLWAKRVDAVLAVVTNAQQYSLAAAANQTQLAQQASRSLATARVQLAATIVAAQNGAADWQAKMIQPLLDTVAREMAASGA